ARFDNRRSHRALPPSVQAKVDESLKVFALLASLLPITDWHLEVGNFDPHKLVHPEVEGIGYQQGEQYGFYNVRECVLWRDRHTCQSCKGKRNDPILEVHHIDPQKKVGSDRPENLITLCKTCHDAHHNGHPLRLKAPPSFRDATQFNILKTHILRETSARRP